MTGNHLHYITVITTRNYRFELYIWKSQPGNVVFDSLITFKCKLKTLLFRQCCSVSILTLPADRRLYPTASDAWSKWHYINSIIINISSAIYEFANWK